jgi:hypothetical protein
MVFPLFERPAVVAGLVNGKARDYPHFAGALQWNLRLGENACQTIQVFYMIENMLTKGFRALRPLPISTLADGLGRCASALVVVPVVVSVVVPMPARV